MSEWWELFHMIYNPIKGPYPKISKGPRVKTSKPLTGNFSHLIFFIRDCNKILGPYFLTSPLLKNGFVVGMIPYDTIQPKGP